MEDLYKVDQKLINEFSPTELSGTYNPNTRI